MNENTPYTEENVNAGMTDEETGSIDTDTNTEETAEETTEESGTPTTYTDEYGEWLMEKSGVKMLVNPSEKWIAENPPTEPEPKPDPEPEPEPEGDAVTWDALAEAYAEGVNSLDK